MKGHPEVIEQLKKVLTKELTAINQYFLHARMLSNWGLVELGKKEYAASIDEMKHADELIQRILMLEGIPNVQKLDKINIGSDIEEMLKSDLNVEEIAIPILREAIKTCEMHSDYVTRELFTKILASEEHHVDWLETQLQLLSKLGKQNYLQSQIEK